MSDKNLLLNSLTIFPPYLIYLFVHGNLSNLINRRKFSKSFVKQLHLWVRRKCKTFFHSCYWWRQYFKAEEFDSSDILTIWVGCNNRSISITNRARRTIYYKSIKYNRITYRYFETHLINNILVANEKVSEKIYYHSLSK